jgi:hypothetical protein
MPEDDQLLLTCPFMSAVYALRRNLPLAVDPLLSVAISLKQLGREEMESIRERLATHHHDLLPP